MSFALLWIEALVVASLWVGLAATVFARVPRKWASRASVAMAWMIPFIIFAAFTAFSAWLKFGVELRANCFWWGSTLLIAYCIVGIVVLVFATRSAPDAPGWVAARWSFGRMAAMVLTAMVVLFLTYWNMELALRSQAQSLRSDAGMLMLEVSPPPVSDSQNAALEYEKAFTVMDKDPSLRDSKSPFGKDDLDPKGPDAITILKRHELTLRILLRAAQLPDCRFDHDYAHPSENMLLPELTDARTAARLLQLQARAALARGDVESAVSGVNAISHLSRDIGQEPILIPALVAVSIDALAAQTLSDLLPAAKRPDQLQALRLREPADYPRMLAHAFQGEEAFGLTFLAEMASGRMGSYSNVTVVPLYGVFLMPAEFFGYRQMMDEYRQAALEPYFKAVAHVPSDARIRHIGLITSIIMPSLSRAFEVITQAQALAIDAQVGVAMSRYRLDHGMLPEKLDLLAPDYLDATPTDPFDGKPLRVAHHENEVVIYSIGPDLTDDGGTPFNRKTGKGDVIFKFKVRPAGSANGH